MSLARSWIAWNRIKSTKRMIGVAFASASTVETLSSSPRAGQQFTSFTELLEDVLHAGAVDAVVELDPVFHLPGRCNDHVNVFPQREPEVFRGAQIQRIKQRDADGVVVNGNRQRLMKPGEAARESDARFPARFRPRPDRRNLCRARRR